MFSYLHICITVLISIVGLAFCNTIHNLLIHRDSCLFIFDFGSFSPLYTKSYLSESNNVVSSLKKYLMSEFT